MEQTRLFHASEGEREAKKPPRSNPRPELICRKTPQHWEVVLVADQAVRVDAVIQQNEELEGVNGQWLVRSFAENISISLTASDRLDVPLAGDKPLIFKLNKQGDDVGRHVASVTRGHFLVIARRELKRMGHEQFAPEACSDPGFRAHFFCKDGNESEIDRLGFEGTEIPLSGSHFSIEGQRIFDDSDEGDLFGGQPPSFNASANVLWARVGEEQPDGWAKNFKPQEAGLSDVLDGRQGRFFVRAYDSEGRLLDSVQFRYLRALKGIQVNGAPYCQHTLLLPDPTGHPVAKVQFTGNAKVDISDISSGAASSEGDTLEAQPTPDGDDFQCRLEAEGCQVCTRVTLPRIWWRVDRGPDVEGAWGDRPLQMSRQEFQKLAKTKASVQLRVPKRIRSVYVGFDGEENRPSYPSRNGCVTLPLADFTDYAQIAGPLTSGARFNVQFDEAGQEPLCLVRVSADPPPEVVWFCCEPTTIDRGDQATLRWRARNAASVSVVIEPSIGEVGTTGELVVAPKATTTYTLKVSSPGLPVATRRVTARVRLPPSSDETLSAHVRCGRGWRPGKGFSARELRSAGLPASGGRQRSVPRDPRRRSSHWRNVETLRRWMNA